MLSENRSRVMRLHMLLDHINSMTVFLGEDVEAGVLSLSCSNGERQLDVVFDKPRVEVNGMLLNLLGQEKALLEAELRTLE